MNQEECSGLIMLKIKFIFHNEAKIKKKSYIIKRNERNRNIKETFLMQAGGTRRVRNSMDVQNGWMEGWMDVLITGWI